IGASGSPISSSPFAAHDPQSELRAQLVHFVTRVTRLSRTPRRNFSHPSRTLPSRTLYLSTCDSTQIDMLPYGSMANEFTPPPQSYTRGVSPSTGGGGANSIASRRQSETRTGSSRS